MKNLLSLAEPFSFPIRITTPRGVAKRIAPAVKIRGPKEKAVSQIVCLRMLDTRTSR